MWGAAALAIGAHEQRDDGRHPRGHLRIAPRPGRNAHRLHVPPTAGRVVHPRPAPGVPPRAETPSPRRRPPRGTRQQHPGEQCLGVERLAATGLAEEHDVGLRLHARVVQGQRHERAVARLHPGADAAPAPRPGNSATPGAWHFMVLANSCCAALVVAWSNGRRAIRRARTPMWRGAKPTGCWSLGSWMRWCGGGAKGPWGSSAMLSAGGGNGTPAGSVATVGRAAGDLISRLPPIRFTPLG